MLRGFLRALRAMRQEKKEVVEFIGRKFNLDAATAEETYKVVLQTLSEDGTVSEDALKDLLATVRSALGNVGHLADDAVRRVAVDRHAADPAQPAAEQRHAEQRILAPEGDRDADAPLREDADDEVPVRRVRVHDDHALRDRRPRHLDAPAEEREWISVPRLARRYKSAGALTRAFCPDRTR